jgi:hypothetical protein
MDHFYLIFLTTYRWNELQEPILLESIDESFDRVELPEGQQKNLLTEFNTTAEITCKDADVIITNPFRINYPKPIT